MGPGGGGLAVTRIPIIRDDLSRIRGRVSIEMGGEVVREMDNLYVNVGYQRLAQFLSGRAPAFPGFIALGNGDGSSGGAVVTPAAADQVMGFELLRRPIVSQGLIGLATVRYYVQFASTDVPRALTEVALFDSAGFNGQVTAATATTITDGTQNWTVNQWAGWTVYLALGTGSGQKAVINSNTATVLTVATTLSPVPDTTTSYVLGGVGNNNYLYAHAPISPTLTKALQPLNVIWQLALPQN